MNIIILGAGEIGAHLAACINAADHRVCVIDSSESVAAALDTRMDVRIVVGNGAQVSVLEEAGIADCDVFFGLSSHDHTNVVAASIAKALGAKKVVARAHSEFLQDQWLFDFRDHFQIDYFFNPQRLAAVELAKYVRNPNCLIVEEVARGRVELQQLEVRADSECVGVPLKDLGLPPRVRIGSIVRNGRSVVPGGGEALETGDVITLFGNHRMLQQVTHKFLGTRATANDVRVVIFGGGECGLALAQMLEGGRFKSRIFETDPGRCDELSRLLQKATLINADATSAEALREEQVGEADFFVAASPNDEDNVMTCLQAGGLGVGKCLSLIHRADYAETVVRKGEQLGIYGAVSPRVATARDLMRFVTGDAYHTLVSLPGGIDVIEFVVGKESKMPGQTVRSIRWPSGCGLVAVTHGSSAGVPIGDDTLEAGDFVVAMVTKEALPEVRKMLR